MASASRSGRRRVGRWALDGRWSALTCTRVGLSAYLELGRYLWKFGAISTNRRCSPAVRYRRSWGCTDLGLGATVLVARDGQRTTKHVSLKAKTYGRETLDPMLHSKIWNKGLALLLQRVQKVLTVLRVAMHLIQSTRPMRPLPAVSELQTQGSATTSTGS